ncbi:MAG: hypothetical protein Q4P78_07925 [Rothia sp. (in: high G+C Gram-positive bacteria)]|uniref:hypothetical protein n=1 Tax=Rothia sp. (in: high G+C Gram-positive bacteria) TaxID=1885016 RepID=UPI0026DFF6FA|nr:hypothetical protein [Rothia sp. (in: high G+C Gram-positive bacteria)]MDO5751106.1 hypothetical protein [Rothia sp. (in: high G+C Gram-positive bacteria)]
MTRQLKFNRRYIYRVHPISLATHLALIILTSISLFNFPAFWFLWAIILIILTFKLISRSFTTITFFPNRIELARKAEFYIYFHALRDWSFDGKFLTLIYGLYPLKLDSTRYDLRWIYAHLLYKNQTGEWATKTDGELLNYIPNDPSSWWQGLQGEDKERTERLIKRASLSNLEAGSIVPEDIIDWEIIYSFTRNSRGFVRSVSYEGIRLYSPKGSTVIAASDAKEHAAYTAYLLCVSDNPAERDSARIAQTDLYKTLYDNALTSSLDFAWWEHLSKKDQKARRRELFPLGTQGRLLANIHGHGTMKIPVAFKLRYDDIARPVLGTPITRKELAREEKEYRGIRFTPLVIELEKKLYPYRETDGGDIEFDFGDSFNFDFSGGDTSSGSGGDFGGGDGGGGDGGGGGD